MFPVEFFDLIVMCCHFLWCFSDSDDSDVDPAFEVQPYLMNKVGEVEGALIELTQEHQLRVKVSGPIDANALVIVTILD
jgi:hypothetical protein